MTEEEMNDVSYTSTLAKNNEAVRKEVMADLAQGSADGFDAWFDGHFLDPDGGSGHLPSWLKGDLRLAWDAALANSVRSPAAIERIEAVTGEQEPIAWQWHVGSDCWTPCEPPTEDELKDNPSKFRPLYLGRMPSAPACHEPHNSGGVDPLVTRDCAGAGTEVAALHREIVDRQAEIIRLRAQVEQLKSPAATEQSQRDYDHGYGVGYEHGIKEASAECKKLLGLVESATAWLDQEITRAADQQRQSYAMSGEHGQRQGERWHARQIALYEAKLKLTSTDGQK